MPSINEIIKVNNIRLSTEHIYNYFLTVLIRDIYKAKHDYIFEQKLSIQESNLKILEKITEIFNTNLEFDLCCNIVFRSIAINEL